MNLHLNVILIILLPLIAVLIAYKIIVDNTDIFRFITHRYIDFDKKLQINTYKKYIYKKPVDNQKYFFYEGITLIFVFLLIFIVATNGIFFTAVISDSMKPTFQRNDLVLMQNVERSYKVGDIIMFKTPDTLKPYSHRIVSISDKGDIRTGGDAVGIIDWWEIKKEDVLGKAIILRGKTIILKGYGKYFLIDRDRQDLGAFGKDFNKYVLFIDVIRTYGYVIAVISLLLYIFLAFRKPQSLK
jgi:signal peptidase I